MNEVMKAAEKWNVGSVERWDQVQDSSGVAKLSGLANRPFQIGTVFDGSSAHRHLDDLQAGSPAIQQVGNLRYSGHGRLTASHIRHSDIPLLQPPLHRRAGTSFINARRV